MLTSTLELVLAASAGPTYKCKDDKGSWSEAAFIGSAAPQQSEYAKGREEEASITEMRKGRDKTYST